jgi:hypothetical protein
VTGIDAVADSITNVVVATIGDHDPDYSELVDIVAPLWSAEHARRVLDVSRSTMAQQRKRGSLLALRTAGSGFLYPVFQFETYEGKVQVKRGLREFMMTLRSQDPWTVAVVVKTPAPELDGLSPLGWVHTGGDIKVLVDYAKILAAEFQR